MEQANFFQSKIVLSKAFPKKKMTMSRLHQLYRDIYTIKPKSKLLHNNLKDGDKMGSIHGRTAIYDDQETEKMISRYLDNDKESQFRTNDIIQMIHEDRPSKNEVLSQVSKEEEDGLDALDSVVFPSPKKRDELSPIRQVNFFAPLERRGLRSLQGSKYLPQNPKWPSYIDELKESISKHSLRTSKVSGLRYVNTSQREINKSTRDSFSELNSNVKFHLHRIGLNCQRSAIEEADSLARSFAKDNVEKTTVERNLQMSPQMTSKKSIRSRKNLKLMSTDYTAMGMGKEKESLPRIRTTKNSESHLLAPDNMKERVENRLHQLFDSCNKVQRKISMIDKKLEKGGRAAGRNYSNLDMKLQRVMKSNFLPQQMMFDDTL